MSILSTHAVIAHSLPARRSRGTRDYQFAKIALRNLPLILAITPKPRKAKTCMIGSVALDER